MNDDFSHLAGRVFGDTYRLVRVLGQGGMGAVFEATNIRLGKKLALKVMSPDVLEAPDARHRFRREAKIAIDLGHPHVVDVVDFNETADGLPYIVMEYLDGEDFAGVLRRCGGEGMALERLVPIMRQLCWGLQAAHQGGIVHRDLKPDNIFLCRDKEYDDYVKIVDFGISKVLSSTSLKTQEAAILGTPHYMAPEQADQQVGTVGPWTDIYAVGAILYRALANKLPFVTDSLPALLYEIVHKAPPPLASLRPDLPPRVHALVARAMAKSPDQRHPSIRALSLDLLEAAPSSGGPVRQWEREGVDELAETLPPDRPPATRAQVSTLSAAASEVAIPATLVPKRRVWPIGVAAIAGASVVSLLLFAFFAQKPAEQPLTARSGSSAPASRDSATVAPMDVVAMVARDVASQVTIAIEGKPRGARVIEVSSGEVLMTIPGSFSWTRSASPIKLELLKNGYRTTKLQIVPDRDRRLYKSLRRRRASPSELPANPHVR